MSFTIISRQWIGCGSRQPFPSVCIKASRRYAAWNLHVRTGTNHYWNLGSIIKHAYGICFPEPGLIKNCFQRKKYIWWYRCDRRCIGWQAPVTWDSGELANQLPVATYERLNACVSEAICVKLKKDRRSEHKGIKQWRWSQQVKAKAPEDRIQVIT